MKRVRFEMRVLPPTQSELERRTRPLPGAPCGLEISPAPWTFYMPIVEDDPDAKDAEDPNAE